MKKAFIIFGLSCLFAACKPGVNVTTLTPTAGQADFSNYLAVGNSLTSGYTDNSLTVSGQLNSYPERLFEQFQLVPGTKGGSKSYFVQPLLHSDHGYPSAKLVLGYTYNPCTLDSELGPINYRNFVQDPVDAQRYVWPNSDYNNGQINNIGVPGIRISDYLVQGYGAMNPYAARFYNSLATTYTPFDELGYRVRSLHPSFFTLWLGANDVLGYATNGGKGVGDGSAVPVAGNLFNSYDITPFSLFNTIYDSVVRVISGTAAYGAVINIPDITSLPFFTTIPSNGLVITRQSQADSLTSYWRHIDTNIVFHVGANQYVVYTHNNIVRQSVPGELILMTAPFNHASCAAMDSLGSYTPIPNVYALTTEELTMIRNAIGLYNFEIYNESLKYHLAYVDINSYMSSIASGFMFNGINYTTTYVKGGAFSLDGVHLTQRGYAMVANEIIRTINTYYKSTVPSIDVNKYNGVLFP